MAAPPLAGVTVVFDLDGTLVDTASDVMGALNAVLAKENLRPASLPETRAMIGGGARALLARALASRGAAVGEAPFERLFEDLSTAYRSRIAQESRPYPGVAATLNALTAAGARLAVATNKRTSHSTALLESLDLSRHFAAVVGMDAAPAAKPDPRHLVRAVEMAGGDPSRAIMVGDSESDARAARAAAMPVILVKFGYCDTPAALGPDILIGHFDELPGACARLVRAMANRYRQPPRADA